MKRLALTCNRIQAVSELDNLLLPALEEVSVAANPVCRTRFYRQRLILNLKNLCVIDGNSITDEERTRAEAFREEQALYASPTAADAFTEQVPLIPTVLSNVRRVSLKVNTVHFGADFP